MTQLSFFDDPNKLVRKTDPQTSKEAAIKTVAFKASHSGLIWGALEKAGKLGVTQNEISGLTPVQANRRFAEMSEKKLIERHALTDCSGFETRKGCCIWWKR